MMQHRDIQHFKGKNVVIGCGASCRKHCAHHPQKDYFSINIDQSMQPDFVFDVTAKLPDTYTNAFHITFVEFLDFWAYNQVVEGAHLANGEQGFKNILNMTEENGYIVIAGCPRLKIYRSCVKDLKYIELNSNEIANEVIIIPKNQNLSIEELKQSISHDSGLNKLVQSLTKTDPASRNIAFSKISYDELDTIKSQIEKLAHAQNECCEKIRKCLLIFLDRVIEHPNNAAKATEFVNKSIQILSEDKVLSEKIKAIKSLEELHFKHQDPLTRILADVLWIPLGIATLGIGFVAKKYFTGSYTFFGEPVKEQRLLNELVPNLH